MWKRFEEEVYLLLSVFLEIPILGFALIIP